MPNAKDINPKTASKMAAVLGPGGTGKSTFIKSAAKLGGLAVALSPVSELDTYVGSDITYEIFMDEGWIPHKNSFKAGAFRRLLKQIDKWTADDSIKTIGIDSVSACSDLAMHEALEMHQTDNPMDLSHGAAYMGHNGLMKQLLQSLELATLKGKNVICTFHTELRESETQGKAKDKAGPDGSVAFEEKMLPVMHGSMRQHVHKHFSLWLFTEVSGYNSNVKYFLRSVPGKVEGAKSRLAFKKEANPMRLPNDFGGILEMIDYGD